MASPRILVVIALLACPAVFARAQDDGGRSLPGMGVPTGIEGPHRAETPAPVPAPAEAAPATPAPIVVKTVFTKDLKAPPYVYIVSSPQAGPVASSLGNPRDTTPKQGPMGSLHVSISSGPEKLLCWTHFFFLVKVPDGRLAVYQVTTPWVGQPHVLEFDATAISAAPSNWLYALPAPGSPATAEPAALQFKGPAFGSSSTPCVLAGWIVRVWQNDRFGEGITPIYSGASDEALAKIVKDNPDYFDKLATLSRHR